MPTNSVATPSSVGLISNVVIFPVSGNDKVKANAYITVANMFKIKATIMENDKGLFVSFPGRYYTAKDGTQKWASDVETVNKEVTKTVQTMLVTEYQKKTGKSGGVVTTASTEEDESAY